MTEIQAPYSNGRPRLKTYRNEKFLRFIRSKSCLKTGGKARAAHQGLGLGIMGGKPSDIQTLPLSDDAHNFAGDSEHNGQVTFWTDYFGLDPSDFASWDLLREHINGLKALLMIRYVNEYLSMGGKL